MRIKDTYIKHSTAQKTKLYDMYSRFYRWAMDRLGNEGIIAFITNRSFINSRTFDGFRKIAASEFDHIYIVDLGGDVRANPKLSGPKHNVFAIQTGVAIMFMVKTSDNCLFLTDDKEDEFNYLKKSLDLDIVASEPVVYYGGTKYISPKGCRIFYIRRPEMEIKEDKLEFLSQTKIHDLIKNGSFDHIRPDKNNNWLDLTDNDWETMIPLASKTVKSGLSKQTLFEIYSLGASTNRDEWVTDVAKDNLKNKAQFIIEFLKKINNKKNIYEDAIKWSRNLKRRIKNGKTENFSQNKIKVYNYRPFIKFYFYDSELLIDEISSIRNLFINRNPSFATMGISSDKPFSILSIDTYTDLNYLSPAANGCRIFSFYNYNNCGKKIENITDWGLEQFHTNYNDKTINKEDIFNYVYAVLHNPEYRKKYEMNLKREFPRIPFYDDFWKWAGWGKKLIDLHINFETVEEYPLKETTTELNKEVYKPKLKANKDTGTIELDNQTTLSGIPKEVWDYKLGNRSALEWILDQYKEKKPKDPTIAEKFNTYRFIDYKYKVIDLLKRVTTVSVETVKIVEEMKSV